MRRHRLARAGARALVGSLCSLVLLGALPVQEAGVSHALQSSFLLSVLEYERSLENRAGEHVVIGILYQPLYRASVNVHDGMKEGLLEAQLGRPQFDQATVVSVETTDGSNLAEELERLEVDVLYVAPLRSVPLESVTTATRYRSVMSFTGVPEYVSRGVCVGVRAREGRPRLMVNREAAAAEGVQFSSELLKVAELMDEEDVDR